MSDTAFILIVEEDAAHAEALADGLKQAGHAARIANSGEEALSSIHTRAPDVIVADGTLAGVDNGLRILKQTRQLAPYAEIIVMYPDGQSDAGRVSEAVRELEVFDWLPKPTKPDEVRAVVARAARQALDKRERRAYQEQADRSIEFDGIITANPQMITLIGKLQKAAASKLTVLLLGESGTGKELFARAVHTHSPRSNKPYRAINCAGLHENLLESELFGHVKGAFTGAVTDRKGLFESVDGGTIFLDEVGDMPPAMQAKLLRTLEHGEILPVGSNEIKRVDVRVVAATRKDVRAMMDDHEFRDDLYYRLHQATIRIPPLRERREDVPLLVNHFLKEASEVHEKDVSMISSEAVRRLTAYQWPGNVRQLRSVIDSMVVLTDNQELDLDDLPESIRGSGDIVVAGGLNTAGLSMEQMEKLHIANTLKINGGNREKTAKMLGIGARTLYRKLREYELQ